VGPPAGRPESLAEEVVMSKQARYAKRSQLRGLSSVEFEVSSEADLAKRSQFAVRGPGLPASRPELASFVQRRRCRENVDWPV